MRDENNNKTCKITPILTNNADSNLSQDSAEIDGGAISIQAPHDSLDEEMLSTKYSEDRKSETPGGYCMPSA